MLTPPGLPGQTVHSQATYPSPADWAFSNKVPFSAHAILSATIGAPAIWGK